MRLSLLCGIAGHPFGPHGPSATGIKWVNGKPIRSRIFEILGEYEVILAENLETEPENTISYTQQITFSALEEQGP